MQITLDDELAADLKRFCEVRLQTIRFVSARITSDALISASMKRETSLIQGLLDALTQQERMQ